MFGFHFFELLDANGENVTSDRQSDWQKRSVNSTRRVNNEKVMIANNLEFFVIDGKRYYGSNPGNKESKLTFYGATGLEFDDHTEHLIELTRLYPELFIYKPKTEYTGRLNGKRIKYCVGNVLFQNGRAELAPQLYGCGLFHDQQRKIAPEKVLLQL